MQAQAVALLRQGDDIMKKIKVLLGGLLILLILMQLMPVEYTNPPVKADLQAKPAVKNILKRACYDCHSNETVWPWYSRVVPVAWQIVEHVEHGREDLNFSDWENYTIKKREHKMAEIWEEINEGHMPLEPYLFMHKDAELTVAEKKIIREWSESNIRSKMSDEDY